MNIAGPHALPSQWPSATFSEACWCAPRVREIVIGSRRKPLGLGATLLVMLVATTCWAKSPQVKHVPQQPKSGDSVQITLELTGKSIAETCLLEYQVVEPGKYIALKDPEFQSVWTTLKMQKSRSDAGGTEGRPVFSVQMPPEVQKHRRLVRYRIRSAADNKVIAPVGNDAQSNFAYFVYDAVPQWKGAIDPKSNDENLRHPVSYSGEMLRRVPVYHFISSKSSVEKATWYEPASWDGREGRNLYKYTGTMVYEGIVYDHVAFRARGGEWRHAMGKNMWKFNFLQGHHFQARDDYGIAYAAKWDKLNLGACVQQGEKGMRGEAGMFEAVGFQLFNLAGVEAPHTHWVHLRIIDEEQENPSDQYSGDFWGLYLAVENVDGHFVKEHDLPAGNLYKIESWRPKTAFNGDPAITNQSDALQFISQVMRGQQNPVSWWQQNVEMSAYYSYRSIIECIHHYDLDMGKNFFFYLNPASHRWTVIPWDLDQTWSERMFGRGNEPFYRTGLLLRSPFKEQYQERLAEIRDLLFNPEQIGLLIDEHARFISDPSGARSIVDADRAKWDFHPILASPQVLPRKAGQGRFYFANPQNRFNVMTEYMKNYVARRTEWLDQNLLADYRPFACPEIVPEGAPKLTESNLKFRIQSKPDTNIENVDWRLAEITDPKGPSFSPDRPWRYEMQALWEIRLNKEQTVAVPTNLLVPGHVYRVRARWAPTGGQWSRWSSPVQFIAEK